MEIKGLVPEDFVQYKKASMVILCPTCTFKCDKECKSNVCQNSKLALAPSFYKTNDEIIREYISNDITHAIVFGGLEPFDCFSDILKLIQAIRKETDDDIVIYSGYYPEEISGNLALLRQYPNIIVKFGRFIPNRNKVHSDLLGVDLASDNQFALLISEEKEKGMAETEEKKLKIRPRPILDDDDKELVDAINEGLEKNKKEFGKRYCPCSLEHTDDTVCPCKAFREQTEPGFCHCGKFEKYYEQ